jgi:translation initiation factor 4E
MLCLCSLYNNIKPPSWLSVGTDFHLFKEGVEPKWEDPTCEHGGKWTVLVPKSPNSKQVLDTYWLNAVRTTSSPSAIFQATFCNSSSLGSHSDFCCFGTRINGLPGMENVRPLMHELCWTQLLACIGEQFTEGDEICGIVVNVRAKQDKLCVWTKTAANEAAQVMSAAFASSWAIVHLVGKMYYVHFWSVCSVLYRSV